MDLTGIIGLSITRAYARDISGHALLHSCRVSFLADRWRSSTLGSAIKETALMQVSIVCRMMDRQRIKADSTLRSSQAVPHPSTNRALCRLTSEVRRDPVYSTRYGRQRMPKKCSLVVLNPSPPLPPPALAWPSPAFHLTQVIFKA